MNEATQSPSPEGMSTISRIIGVITSPRATFDDIVQKPTWLLPFLLVVVLGVVNSYLLIDIIADEQIEQMSQNPNMTEQQMEMASNITRNYGWMFAIATTPLFYVIVAAVLLFTGNVILGGESRFKVLFSVTCWSGIISIIASAITVPVMISREAIESPTSLAFLAPSDDKTSFLYGLLSSLDLLTFWYVAVMGIGVAAAYRFTSQKGIVVTTVWWLILIVVGAGWRAMFS